MCLHETKRSKIAISLTKLLILLSTERKIALPCLSSMMIHMPYVSLSVKQSLNVGHLVCF